MKISDELNVKVKELQKARLSLDRLEKALTEATKQSESLQMRLGTVVGERSRSIAEGRDTEKQNKESRSIKADMIEQDSLIDDLSVNAIPVIKGTIKTLEEELRIDLRGQILLVKAEHTQKLDEQLEQGLMIVEDYRREIASFLEQVNIHFDPETSRELFLLYPKSESFKSYLRKELLLSGVGVN